jgi:NADH-quinone oxidoreductase subunit L
MEHGSLHTGDEVNPQDMFNMGGLRRTMPITFWTFLIGGLALSGFPILTAGFWSKDEILAEAFGNGHWVVFLVLAVAAFLTAFYTMRQITLTFFGSPRSRSAEHASESTWTMTVPLVLLGIFAVGFGWLGIPEQFPVLGGILPNWFHAFVGGTLQTPPAEVAFSAFPLLTSIGVSLVGLLCGWWVYRGVRTPQTDFLQIPLLKNKYYIDEAYDRLFVKPALWISEQFTYLFLDRTVIDGVLHAIARAALFLGTAFRTYIDKPVINGVIGDGTATVVKVSGFNLRKIQAGRIQAYMIISIAGLVVVAVLLYFLHFLLA